MVGADSQHLELALNLGASHTVEEGSIDPVAGLMDLLDGYGADAILVCASDQFAMELAMRIVGSQGRIVVEGHYTPSAEVKFSPFDLLVDRSVTICANRGWLTKDYVKAMELVSDSIIDARNLITHRFTLNQWDSAFDLYEKNDDYVIQVAIKP